jgi:hypothetical protein
VAGGCSEGGVLAERVEQFEVANVDIHKQSLDLSSKIGRGRMDAASVR